MFVATTQCLHSLQKIICNLFLLNSFEVFTSLSCNITFTGVRLCDGIFL